MDQIKEYMATNYLEPHMKRKISTYFNQIDNKSWTYSNLRDKLNRLDDILCNMRARNQVFQDNGDLVETVWEKVYEHLMSQLDGNESYFNVYIGHYSFTFNNQWRPDEDQVHKPALVFTWKLPDTVCNYFIGNNPYSIPIYETEVIHVIDLDDFLYRISSNLDWVDGHTNYILRNSTRRLYSRGSNNLGSYNQWAALYNRQYINECNDNFGNQQLLHPYISSEEWRSDNKKIEFIDKSTFNIAYACVGDHHSSLSDSMSKLNLQEAYATFYNWHTVFNATSTHPMNSPKTMFYGMHPGMDTEEFQNVISTKISDCRILANNSHGPKTYCDEYECLHRKECSYYNYDPDKVASDTPENILEDAQWNPENIAEIERNFPETAQAMRETFDEDFEVVDSDADNIHGGEYAQTHTIDRDDGEREQETAANYREEMDRINGDEDIQDIPLDEDVLSIEERMIIWAAQQGGALNIANNERNQNG